MGDQMEDLDGIVIAALAELGEIPEGVKAPREWGWHE